MRCEECPLCKSECSDYLPDGDSYCLITGEVVFEESSCRRTNKYILAQDPEEWMKKRMDEVADRWNEFADWLEKTGGVTDV